MLSVTLHMASHGALAATAYQDIQGSGNVAQVCKYDTHNDADWLAMCGHEMHVEIRDPTVRQRQIEMAKRQWEKNGHSWSTGGGAYKESEVDSICSDAIY
jgi:hypothetical protein